MFNKSDHDDLVEEEGPFDDGSTKDEDEEDLMIESSNEIMKYHGFKIDKLCVNAGIIEDKPSYGIVLNEAERFQAKYDDDYFSNEEIVSLVSCACDKEEDSEDCT